MRPTQIVNGVILFRQTLRKILAGMFNPVTDAYLSLQPPAAIWRKFEASPTGSYFHRRSWQFLNTHESSFPEPVRAAFANYKWNSQWFFDAWFSKPLALDHVEARFRVLRQLRAACFADPEIMAIDDWGTANGTFVRDATNVVPNLNVYRGWEISAKAVEVLQAKYSDDPRLQFHRTDVEAVVAAPLKSVLITSGTFQYIPEHKLAEFLKSYRARPDAKIILSEISQFGLAPAPASTLRAYQTYNHDYVRMLETAGFEVLSRETFSHYMAATWVIISAASEL
jgi:hypothetical protein